VEPDTSWRSHLHGKWTYLRRSVETRSSQDYSRFDIHRLSDGDQVGRIDSRQTFPRVFQIGIELEDRALSSGAGLDAAITLGAWLFDFREAYALAVITSVDNRPLDGLFRLGVARQTAVSPSYLSEGSLSRTARWGMVTKEDFEPANILLSRIRDRYPPRLPSRVGASEPA
jgi:hypothetical protein